MLNFIVVEDNNSQREKMKKIIIKYMMRNDIDYDVLEYNDLTTDLINYINDNHYDNIYILDYELPTSDALDISRLVREEDWTSPIIINTVHGKLAFETFKQKLQILDFLDKSDTEEHEYFSVFDVALKVFKKKPNLLKFRECYKEYSISMDSILYIYRDSYIRKLVIVTDHGEYFITRNVKDMLKLLDNRFKITHKACIVNMERVEALLWREGIVKFENGMQIDMLSKTHKKEIMEYGLVI